MGDVYWVLPHLKRSFANTSLSTSDLIVLLSEDYMTVKDVYNAINYDYDAKKVLKGFIDAGYENFIMKDFVTQNVKGLYRKKENGEIKIIPRSELKKVITKELKKKNTERGR